MVEKVVEPRAIGVMKSRIGRRFVVMFLGCALLPLVAFSWLTLTRVTGQMHDDAREALHLGAKTAGMGIAARLSKVAGDLAVVNDLVEQHGTVAARGRDRLNQVAAMCSSVWIVDGEHIELLRGEQVLLLPALAPRERAHLAAGNALVRTLGSPPQLAMIRLVGSNPAATRLLVAALDEDRFWSADELRNADSEFAVFDEDGRLVVHSFPQPPPATPLLAAVKQQPASGTIEWRVEDEPHLARYWRVFLRPQYDFDMLVVHSKSRREAFRVLDEFSRSLLLTALCTMLCVLGASLVQMRRTLGPIMSLHAGTRRVAQGDLGARVSIIRGDEFADLGAAFNHMAEQLAESVQRREQTERELTASRDAALAAARAKAEFVTNVSHEFRTPMTEILGAAEILHQLESGDEASRLEFSTITLSGARRLARLVDDVLELGSTNAWEQEPVDVAATIAAAIDAMPAEVRERIRPEIARDLPPVMGSSLRLTNIWHRLLDNAGKFSERGSPIEILARRRDGEIVVEFIDKGVGIAKSELAQLFEPFRQVGRDQMIDKARGAGLGLALTKSTVERHGGRIEVASQLGVGSTFRVILPAHVTAEPVG
ncbi:MAG TPA: ATP-binding protein [Planctomycetota bacterium]